MDIGHPVVQYSYVEKREARGTIVAVREVYSARTDSDITVADVLWSDDDGGVTTTHPLDDFTAIAAREEWLVNTKE